MAQVRQILLSRQHLNRSVAFGKETLFGLLELGFFWSCISSRKARSISSTKLNSSALDTRNPPEGGPYLCSFFSRCFFAFCIISYQGMKHRQNVSLDNSPLHPFSSIMQWCSWFSHVELLYAVQEAKQSSQMLDYLSSAQQQLSHFGVRHPRKVHADRPRELLVLRYVQWLTCKHLQHVSNDKVMTYEHLILDSNQLLLFFKSIL